MIGYFKLLIDSHKFSVHFSPFGIYIFTYDNKYIIIDIIIYHIFAYIKYIIYI